MAAAAAASMENASPWWECVSAPIRLPEGARKPGWEQSYLDFESSTGDGLPLCSFAASRCNELTHVHTV